jgi:CRISPR-associated protein Cmr4
MSEERKPFVRKTYYAMTLDPVHIGTGGFRLGRVDNTIAREPGTNIPKIPGSSIAGAARAYTAMAVQSENPMILKKMKYQRPGEKETRKKEDGTEEEVTTYYSCAGKGGKDGDGHCGEPNCEVCVPFGFSRGKSKSSFQGLAQFYDARILFFPVSSMFGPVWVTCPSILSDFCGSMRDQGVELTMTNQLDSDESIQTALVGPGESLNLGWLLLKNTAKTEPLTGSIRDLPAEIYGRAVLISDRVFSCVVNDNLEVRTSVAIDPATGAAEDGALYTYEAIPRATILWFDVIYNKPEHFRINGNTPIALESPKKYSDPLRSPSITDQMGYVAFNVEKGLRYLEALGVGGMNTRGMGRLRVLNLGNTNAVDQLPEGVSATPAADLPQSGGAA